MNQSRANTYKFSLFCGRVIDNPTEPVYVLLNLLEGKKVNLRIMEREDLSIMKKWDNDLGIKGEYEPIVKETQADLKRQFGKLTFE